MALSKNFIVKNGLEVAKNLIYADSDLKYVGIGTTIPEYSFEVINDIGLNNRFYVGVVTAQIKTTTGIASAASPGVISGIDTSLIRINDKLTESLGVYFNPGTRIISIGPSIVGLSQAHKNGIGSTSLTIDITRKLTSGNKDEILVSNGEFIGPQWKPFDDIAKVKVQQNDDDVFYNVVFAGEPETVERFLKVDNNGLIYNPFRNHLGIGAAPTVALDVEGDTKISLNLDVGADLNVDASATIANETSTSILTVNNSSSLAEAVANNITVANNTTTNTLDVSINSSLAVADATQLTVTGDSFVVDVFSTGDVEAVNFRVGAAPSLTNLQLDNYNLYNDMGTFTAVPGVQYIIDTYSVTSPNYKVADYTLFVEGLGNIQSQKVLLMQNGSIAFSEEYAIMFNPAILVSVGATITGTTCNVFLTPVEGISGTVSYMFSRNTLR
jgi:hypothetical protein